MRLEEKNTKKIIINSILICLTVFLTINFSSIKAYATSNTLGVNNEKLFKSLDSNIKGIEFIEIKEFQEEVNSEESITYSKMHKIKYDEDKLIQISLNENFNKEYMIYNSEIFVKSSDDSWYSNGEATNKGVDIKAFLNLIIENSSKIKIEEKSEGNFKISSTDIETAKKLLNSLGIKRTNKLQEESVANNLTFEIQMDNTYLQIDNIKVNLKNNDKNFTYNFKLSNINVKFDVPEV